MDKGIPLPEFPLARRGNAVNPIRPSSQFWERFFLLFRLEP